MVPLDQQSSQTIFRLTTKNVIPCLSVNPMASFLIRIEWEKPFGILNKSQNFGSWGVSSQITLFENRRHFPNDFKL